MRADLGADAGAHVRRDLFPVLLVELDGCRDLDGFGRWLAGNCV